MANGFIYNGYLTYIPTRHPVCICGLYILARHNSRSSVYMKGRKTGKLNINFQFEVHASGLKIHDFCIMQAFYKIGYLSRIQVRTKRE